VPRAKKPAGTAVDRRNGERSALPAVALARFSLPRRSDGLKYDLRTQRMWRALWDDERLASVLSPVDRELVIRWAQSVDDWIKAVEAARESPISKGSMGQEVASPHYAIAAQALAAAERCEAQIGVGALNRARLGIAILAEQASLASLAGQFPGGGGDERDPRLP
jgi:P27 family predicted phage terminase small subunit